jgi:hypothetical protein
MTIPAMLTATHNLTGERLFVPRPLLSARSSDVSSVPVSIPLVLLNVLFLNTRSNTSTKEIFRNVRKASPIR